MTRFKLLVVAVAVPIVALGVEIVVLSLPHPERPPSTAQAPLPSGIAGTEPSPGASSPAVRNPAGTVRSRGAAGAARAPSGSAAGYAFVTKPKPEPSREPGAPRILEVDFNDHVLHAPGPLAFRVLTTDDVVLVRAELMGREVQVPKVGSGVFAASGTIPNIPFVLYGDKTITVVATTVDGRRAESNVTVHVEH